MRTHCELCGGLGVQIEVRPWGMARRICEAGHQWITVPEPYRPHAATPAEVGVGEGE